MQKTKKLLGDTTMERNHAVFSIFLGVLIIFANTASAQWRYDDFMPANDQIQNNECIVRANDEFAVYSNSEGGYLETGVNDENTTIDTNAEFQ